jgi:hypothetical protein
MTELLKKLSDKEWRVEHLYKIVDKNSRLIVFKKNPIQRYFDESKHNRNLILKARQQGFTTYECIDGLDDVLFHKNFTMVIIAHEDKAVKNIFKKIRRAWDEIEPDLKSFLNLVVNTDSANELSFNNGSAIRVALSSRSDTVNRLHISELGKICAKYPGKAEEIITGAFPSVPRGGRIDIESTAEGELGEFHDMFWQYYGSETKNEIDFKAFFFPWFNNPEYSLKAKVDLPKDMVDYQVRFGLSVEQITWYYYESLVQKGKMKQEYPSTPDEAFISSGNTFFDPIVVGNIRTKVGHQVGDWTYYDSYISGHIYVLGADVAEGVGRDSSTCVVLDTTKNEPIVVAEYKSNRIPPDLFAYEVKNGATMYGNCLAAVERNNHGHTTLSKLKEIYYNIYLEEKFDNLLNKRTKKLGWHTNLSTKPKMLSELCTAVNESNIEVVSPSIVKEMRTYQADDLNIVKAKSDDTKHWDLLMALAIAYQMRTNVGAKKEQYTFVRTFNPYKSF